MEVENFVLVFSTKIYLDRRYIMTQLTTIDVKGFRLNTVIQRFNQLSLQNLSLVSIRRKFGYFTFVCELVDRENWKGGYDPKDRPNLSEMSFNEVCLRVVSLLITAYGQNMFRGSSCLKYNLQKEYISIPSSKFLKDEPICKEIFRILRYLRKEKLKLDADDLKLYAKQLGYAVEFGRPKEYNFGGRVYLCKRIDFVKNED